LLAMPIGCKVSVFNRKFIEPNGISNSFPYWQCKKHKQWKATLKTWPYCLLQNLRLR
jgi:hypothetical protein